MQSNGEVAQNLVSAKIEIEESIRLIAERRGLNLGVISLIPVEEGVFGSITILTSTPSEFYRKAFFEFPIRDLPEEVQPGMIISDPYSELEYVILGRDPDGADDQPLILATVESNEKDLFRVSVGWVKKALSKAS
jgi:hypothetical protein